MLSEEEKKAIAKVKDVIEYDKEHRIVTIYDKQPLFRDTLQTILNLIEKQSKEIEELKDKYSDEKIRNTVIKRYREVIEKDYISKDKIKTKIEELENDPDNIEEHNCLKVDTCYAINILQSLLEKE